MSTHRNDIRLALPSKGRLAVSSLEFLEDAGLRVYKPNPRQLKASIPSTRGLTVLFQRAGDIVVSVRDGSVDFGLTGWDTVCERRGTDGTVLPLLKELGYGHCTLNVIVPEGWTNVRQMKDLLTFRNEVDQSIRVATKFPRLSADFFSQHGMDDICFIKAEGTLEVAPAIGYADLIVDLVSTGTTLRDNRLRALEDGEILRSQACLIANRRLLRERSEVLSMARRLLEFIEAHLRASANVSVFANIRGVSAQDIAQEMFKHEVIGGLQGPTISPVITREGCGWYAVHIVVLRDKLAEAITELRAIGGSGVVVSPVTYIFEEETAAYQAMLHSLEE